MLRESFNIIASYSHMYHFGLRLVPTANANEFQTNELSQIQLGCIVVIMIIISIMI